jgi:hypothetical protein
LEVKVPYSIVLHVAGSEPVLGEVDELPTTTDITVKLHNPRRMDGKDLSYLAENVTIVYWPMERLNFIEVLSSEEEENIFGFVRE